MFIRVAIITIIVIVVITYIIIFIIIVIIIIAITYVIIIVTVIIIITIVIILNIIIIIIIIILIITIIIIILFIIIINTISGEATIHWAPSSYLYSCQRYIQVELTRFERTRWVVLFHWNRHICLINTLNGDNCSVLVFSGWDPCCIAGEPFYRIMRIAVEVGDVYCRLFCYKSLIMRHTLWYIGVSSLQDESKSPYNDCMWGTYWLWCFVMTLIVWWLSGLDDYYYVVVYYDLCW